MLGWLVGEEICSVSIGGDSRLILEDLGHVAGLYEVMVQSDYPRNVRSRLAQDIWFARFCLVSPFVDERAMGCS